MNPECCLGGHAARRPPPHSLKYFWKAVLGHVSCAVAVTRRPSAARNILTSALRPRYIPDVNSKEIVY